MTRFTKSILALATLSVVLTTSALAAPNDGRFKKSAEGMKKQLVTACAQLKQDLDVQEYWADKNAGTMDAKPYAEAADALWAAGEKAGCSWAQ
jgi:hypothetical protein